MDFKQKLKRLAQDANLSMREVAERANVGSHSTVARWLSGEAEPRLSDLVRLANMFDVTVAYLADEKVDDPKAGAAAISDADQKMIEKGRSFGVEHAARVMELAREIGSGEDIMILLGAVRQLRWASAMDRLLGNEKKEETNDR